ncbi:MAG: LacI family DNA-binding transcriptional regulator [Anaerolineaceae bacterium]|nr:LacI family DNA-binding transcriptional regulator [Anaerolineaceae bacterium]
MAKKITLNDVAKIAGVSASTVSRALNDDQRISEKVTARVKEMAEQIGYTPNITARSLKTGITNTIGLLVRDISDEWSAALIPFIEKECTALDYALLLSNADSSLEREKYYRSVFQQLNTDGVIILTPLFLLEVSLHHLPFFVHHMDKVELNIPLDRMIQQAMQQTLSPIFEETFSPHNYGFRPGRSAHDAVKAARDYIDEGYSCVVDIDLEKFFDTINHDRLMARMRDVIEDKRVLRLVNGYLAIERATGVSLLFGLPWWGMFLAKCPKGMSLAILNSLDGVARHLSSFSDVVVLRCRPK